MTDVSDDLGVGAASYSTLEVAELAGLTYRIVDYWVRQGVIWPAVEAHGSGTRREWSEQQASWLMRIGEAYRMADHRGLDLTALAVGHIWRALQDGEDWEINLWVGPVA